MKKKNSITIHIVFQLILFVLFIFIDRMTKIIATNQLKDRDPVVLIKNILEFRYLENTGAAFSMMENKMWLFYVITVIILLVIAVVWFKINSALKKYLALGQIDPNLFRQKTFNQNIFLNYILVTLAAGAIGNFIDRITQHYVIDFIYIKAINFAIFNFADICVTVSAIVLVILFIFIYKDDKNFKIFASKQTEDNTWK